MAQVVAAVAKGPILRACSASDMCNIMKQRTRFCRVCGQQFQSVRFDAETCSTTCRMRRSRGQDLAYLDTLPPDQASARRFLHEALESDIAIARSVGAARREGRHARRELPTVKRMHVGPSRSR